MDLKAIDLNGLVKRQAKPHKYVFDALILTPRSMLDNLQLSTPNWRVHQLTQRLSRTKTLANQRYHQHQRRTIQNERNWEPEA